MIKCESFIFSEKSVDNPEKVWFNMTMENNTIFKIFMYLKGLYGLNVVFLIEGRRYFGSNILGI